VSLYIQLNSLLLWRGGGCGELGEKRQQLGVRWVGFDAGLAHVDVVRCLQDVKFSIMLKWYYY
jgi:hypothetical protein